MRGRYGEYSAGADQHAFTQGGEMKQRGYSERRGIVLVALGIGSEGDPSHRAHAREDDLTPN